MRSAPRYERFPVLALTLLLGAVGQAAYPDRAVTLVTPYPLTGPVEIAGVVRTGKVLRLMESYGAPTLTDRLAAGLERALPETLGQAVRIERRPRMQSLEGVRYVARALPDGYTMLLSDGGEVLRHPQLYRGLQPLAELARMPVVMIARTALPVTSVADFIRLARGRMQRLTFGSAGVSSLGEMAGEQLSSAGGIRLLHVLFNGGTEAANGIVRNQIDVAFIALPAVLPFAGSGRLKVLAIADRQRHPLLPGVPTADESGIRGFEVSGWFGLFAPAHAPSAVAARVGDGVAAAVRLPTTRRMLLRQGLRGGELAPPQFRALVASDIRRAASKRRFAHRAP